MSGKSALDEEQEPCDSRAHRLSDGDPNDDDGGRVSHLTRTASTSPLASHTTSVERSATRARHRSVPIALVRFTVHRSRYGTGVRTGHDAEWRLRLRNIIRGCTLLEDDGGVEIRSRCPRAAGCRVWAFHQERVQGCRRRLDGGRAGAGAPGQRGRRRRHQQRARF